MNKNNATAAGRLTHLFIGLFVIILLVVNAIFITTATGLVYHYADEQADEVIETIDDDWAPGKDWGPLLSAYVARQDDDAIEIVTSQGERFVSPKAPKIFHRIRQQQMAIRNLRVTDDGVYYLTRQKLHGGQVRVAINVDDLVRLAGWLVGVTIVINLLATIIALPLIRRLARRWTAPLTQLDAEIDQLDPTGSDQQLITVPAEPVEVKNVAESVNELLERQTQAMQREKEFIANASHELKTPLAAIMGHVNLIKRHGDSHPELVSKSLGYIDEESQRMQGMINDLLTLEGHRSSAPVESLDLVAVIRTEITSLRAVYQRQFVTDLPANCQYPMTASDFQRLIHNLVDNAAKYSPTASTITVSLQATNSQLILTVADEGCGIAKANREKVFNRFFREDQSHSSKIPGSGIGLAIVKTIVDKYGGDITITANQPRGTIFTVTLPR